VLAPPDSVSKEKEKKRKKKWYIMAKLLGVTYKDLVRICGGHAKVIGNNTVAIPSTDDEDTRGVIRIELHGSNIVELYEDGSIAFTLAGYPTVTTRNRVNSFLPAGNLVFQRNRRQYFSRLASIDHNQNTETIEIADNYWYAAGGVYPKNARMLLDRRN
jgi:hypothetical protein